MEKEKLISVYLQNMHQAEFGQFISRFFEDFEKASLSQDTDPDFKLLFEELKSKIPTYNKALEQVRGADESKKIAELDKIRDNDIQALKDSIKPYKNAKTDAQKDAYNAIKIVFDNYKNIHKEVYEKQTILINSLISILQSEKYAQHISNLRITDFVNELEKSNKEFNKVFSERSFNNLQKESYNAKQLRKEMTEIYRNISNYAITLANIKQDVFYKKVVDVLNNSRKYYADVLSIRAGKSNKEKNTKPSEE